MHRFALWVMLCLPILYGSVGQASAQRADYPYAPPWFGPYALPVPPMSGGCLAAETTFAPELSTAIATGQESCALHIDLEVPLLAEAVSVHGWGVLREYYRLAPTEAMRMEVPEGKASGSIGGDYFVQTRIRLLKEGGRFRPNVVLNLTLKTAAATTAASKRFYDTPGYYFSVEAGRDLLRTKTAELRAALQLGFLCWETGQTSRQNDALMYGVELAARWQRWRLLTDLSGYSGWMARHPAYRSDYGDSPMVWRTKLEYRAVKGLGLTARLELGLRDYPYTVVGLGASFRFPRLTPRY